MARGLDHERMRFSTMSERQLFTRLGRITTKEKLQNFIFVSEECGYGRLRDEARKKMEALFGFPIFGSIPQPWPPVQAKPINRPQIILRAIDF